MVSLSHHQLCFLTHTSNESTRRQGGPTYASFVTRLIRSQLPPGPLDPSQRSRSVYLWHRLLSHQSAQRVVRACQAPRICLIGRWSAGVDRRVGYAPFVRTKLPHSRTALITGRSDRPEASAASWPTQPNEKGRKERGLYSATGRTSVPAAHSSATSSSSVPSTCQPLAAIHHLFSSLLITVAITITIAILNILLLHRLKDSPLTADDRLGVLSRSRHSKLSVAALPLGCTISSLKAAGTVGRRGACLLARCVLLILKVGPGIAASHLADLLHASLGGGGG